MEVVEPSPLPFIGDTSSMTCCGGFALAFVVLGIIGGVISSCVPNTQREVSTGKSTEPDRMVKAGKPEKTVEPEQPIPQQPVVEDEPVKTTVPPAWKTVGNVDVRIVSARVHEVRFQDTNGRPSGKPKQGLVVTIETRVTNKTVEVFPWSGRDGNHVGLAYQSGETIAPLGVNQWVAGQELGMRRVVAGMVVRESIAFEVPRTSGALFMRLKAVRVSEVGEIVFTIQPDDWK